MLAYFPVPYPDELLYSVIARYGVHTGLARNHKALNRDIFSDESAVAIPDLPSHLNAFVDNVSAVWSINTNEIISTLTLAPFYLPFLETEQAQLVKKSMGSSRGHDIHTRCGVVSSSIRQPSYLRYCPYCIEQQKNDYGEVYWRRTHQLPGVELCLEHRCRLINSTFNRHPKDKHEYVSAASVRTCTGIERVECKKAELLVNKMIGELMLRNTLPSFRFCQWTLFYERLAYQLRLKTGTRVNHSEIYHMLKSFFAGTSFYKFIDVNDSHDWLTCMFRKHRKSFHPIRHLMIMAMLIPGSKIEDIFETIGQYPVNTLKQTKTAPVITMPESHTQKKRSEWLHLNRKHYYPGIKAIRKLPLGGALYVWLYRHDREWLMSSLPRQKPTSTGHHKVDYKQWDQQVINQLQHYFCNAKKRSERERLSRTHLLKQVSRANSVVKHLKDLPKTTVWLREHEESTEDFQIHRLSLVKKKLKLKGLPIKRWRLLREGHIRKELITPKLENYILEAERQGLNH